MSQRQSYFYDVIPVRFELSKSEQEMILHQYPPPTLPKNEEFFDLQQEVKGNCVHIIALLNEYKIHVTKHNKQFIRMNFSHNSGMIRAVIWDNQGEVETYEQLLEEFSIFEIEGTVHEFNNQKSITIIRLTPYEDDIHPFSLLPYTQQNLTDLTIELFSYVLELTSPYKEIALAAMDRFWPQFCMSPAAKGFHHNYLGGLLKHTIGLMRFARYILKFENNHYEAIIKLITVVEKAFKKEIWAKLQSDNDSFQFIWKDTINHLYTMFEQMITFKDDIPNYDMLMTSILFHDIGKLLEYDYTGRSYDAFDFLFPMATDSNFAHRKQTGITMDEFGVMVGHIPYGLLILTKIIDVKSIDISMSEIHEMAHCILCHHGLPEWGSCVRQPQTIEGYLIHIVDYLDSRYENTEKIK